MSETHDVKDLHVDSLLSRNSICGAGVGEKWVNGKPTGQQAIIVFVEKKYTKSDVFSKFSSEEVVPEDIDGIPTDVIEVGKIVKHSFTGKIRPIAPGYSSGHSKVTSGTIGGIFLDSQNRVVLLSNNHVFANENDAKIGDIIFQPGVGDKAAVFSGWSIPPIDNPAIATLVDFTKIEPSGNTHDSAIAQVNESFIRSNMLSPIYPVINKRMAGFADATVNMQVQKCGRTTEYTTGRVISLNASFTIEYDFGPARFDKCIVTSSMSKGGDSGSIIFDMNMNAVGLLFAGSPQVTLSSPFSLVRERYGLQLFNQPQSVVNNNIMFTTDGTIRYENGTINITDNANHHCFVELVGRKISSVSCTVDTGTDRGATWGPGLVVQFPQGILKVNLRYNGTFGGYCNSSESLGIGRVVQNKKYELRIRNNKSTWIGEVKDGQRWYTVVQVPTSVFPSDPVCFRFGKTSELGTTRDFSPPNTDGAGAVGSCSIFNIKIV